MSQCRCPRRQLGVRLDTSMRLRAAKYAKRLRLKNVAPALALEEAETAAALGLLTADGKMKRGTPRK